MQPPCLRTPQGYHNRESPPGGHQGLYRALNIHPALMHKCGAGSTNIQIAQILIFLINSCRSVYSCHWCSKASTSSISRLPTFLPDGNLGRKVYRNICRWPLPRLIYSFHPRKLRISQASALYLLRLLPLVQANCRPLR